VIGVNGALRVISRGEARVYGRVDVASVQSVVDGTDVGKNKVRI